MMEVCVSVLLLTGCQMLTCVLRHGGLVSVPLFLKDNVAKLQHCRDHLQHACQG